MLWSYWKTDILMILIYSHSTCAISKESVLKYDNNSFANIFTIWTYLGNTVSKNVLQMLGCDATSFFCINGKINPSKEVFKN